MGFLSCSAADRANARTAAPPPPTTAKIDISGGGGESAKKYAKTRNEPGPALVPPSCAPDENARATETERYKRAIKGTTPVGRV